MDHTKRLGTAPIFGLIIKFSIPSIISMSVSALYSFCDRIFIGLYAGEDALGGVSVAFPVMMILFAFGGLFGVGGAALISIKFGERKIDEANRIYGNLAVLVVVSSLFLMGLAQLILPQLLTLAGAAPVLMPYAQDYMRIILLGLLFQIASFTLSALVRTEGRPYFAMASQLVAAVVNIGLDYLFIGVLDMGVSGAALGTIIAQMFGLSMLIYYFFISKKSTLKLHAANLRLSFDIVRRICVIGGSTFVINVGTSISAAVMNIALQMYGGKAAVTSMGAINIMIVLVLMPIFGLQQGISPIIGYNHGMRQKKRVRSAFNSGLLISSVFALIMFALMEIFPHILALSFFEQSSSTIAVFIPGLRIQAAFLPLLPITVMITAYFQSTAQGRKGLILSIGRQVLIIVAVLVMPVFWNLTGIWATAPVAEVFTVAIALVLYAAKNHPKKCSEPAD